MEHHTRPTYIEKQGEHTLQRHTARQAYSTKANCTPLLPQYKCRLLCVQHASQPACRAVLREQATREKQQDELVLPDMLLITCRGIARSTCQSYVLLMRQTGDTQSRTNTGRVWGGIGDQHMSVLQYAHCAGMPLPPTAEPVAGRCIEGSVNSGG